MKKHILSLASIIFLLIGMGCSQNSGDSSDNPADRSPLGGSGFNATLSLGTPVGNRIPIVLSGMDPSLCQRGYAISILLSSGMTLSKSEPGELITPVDPNPVHVVGPGNIAGANYWYSDMALLTPDGVYGSGVVEYITVTGRGIVSLSNQPLTSTIAPTVRSCDNSTDYPVRLSGGPVAIGGISIPVDLPPDNPGLPPVK